MAAPAPAHAQRGVAAGVAAGLLGGAIIGGAIASGNGYYGPGYYGYGPRHYGPGYGYYGGPAYVADDYYGGCVWQRQRFWDGYGWRVRRVRVAAEVHSSSLQTGPASPELECFGDVFRSWPEKPFFSAHQPCERLLSIDCYALS